MIKRPSEIPDMTQQPASTPVAFRVHPMRVLIVEDEALVGWSLANMLHRMQLETVVAETAEEAFEHFMAAPFDLLITDRQLPKMKGEDLAASVKKISPNTPVILISALTLPDELKQSSAIDFFLEKPFHMSEITGLISRCLGFKYPDSTHQNAK